MMVVFDSKQKTFPGSASIVVKRTFVVSILFAGVGLLGCKKESKVSPVAPAIESVYTNRAHDAAYIQSLRQSFSNQLTRATEVQQATRDLQAYEEKIKASLPANSDAAALKQALSKDEVWLKLKERVEAARVDGRHAWEEARAKVRVRMEKEALDNQAVREGRANAIDGK